MSKIKKLVTVFCLILLSLQLSYGSGFSGLGSSSNNSSLIKDEAPSFLAVDQAFKFSAALKGNEIIARWDIADHYYMYRDKFKFYADGATLGEATLPPGEEKHDEAFGDVMVFKHMVEIAIPVESADGKFNFTAKFQGCAEAGLCYPPTKRSVELVYRRDGEFTAPGASTVKAPPMTPVLSEQDQLAQQISNQSLLMTVLIFLGLGIGLAFTPCVFPMYPIMSSIIVGQGEGITTRKAFTLSLAYTQGAAITYALLGLAVAAGGASVQGAFQAPWLRFTTAGLFVLLSLAMFGFYELQLPDKLHQKLSNISNNQKSGSVIGVFVMGVLSTLIVSPCTSAPLVGALSYIAQTGDTIIGASALYALGLGIGIPLMIVGVGGAKALPRSGGWMNAVKAVFGVLMLAVALSLLSGLIPDALYLLGWGTLFIVTAIYMGALSVPETSWQKLWKGLGMVALVIGILEVIGAATGSNDPFHPVNLNISSHSSSGAAEHGLAFERVKTVEQLKAKVALAKAQNKAIMLDLYADYCTACKEFERYTFPAPEVQNALENTILLQADVTANDKADEELMEYLNIFGLPTIVFYDKQGNELKQSRVTGFMDAQRFAGHINTIIN